jgi:hypothetical protein
MDMCLCWWVHLRAGGLPACLCACIAVVNKERNARGSQALLSPQFDYPQAQEHNYSMPRRGSILRVKLNEGGQGETDVPESDQNCNGDDDGAPLLQRLQKKSLRSAPPPAAAELSTPQVCACRLSECTSFFRRNVSDQNPTLRQGRGSLR